MRIAYVCADLGIPVFGRKGASIHVRELARALEALGHELLLVTPRAEGERPADFGVNAEAVALDPAHESAVKALRTDDGLDAAVARDVRALLYRDSLRRGGLGPLRDFGPDVVYERYSLFGDAGLQLARALGVPFVLEVNAPLVDEAARHRGLALREAARTIELRVVCAADRVVTVSTALKRWLRELGVDPARVAVVPNGVDPHRFYAEAEERASARAELGANGAPLVGFVGSLRPWHDVHGLIAAIAAMRRDVKLVVIGEGPEQAWLEAEARRAGVDARFTGGVPHATVPAYLGALDIAVAPYASSDGFYFSPLKVVEYLAAAVPVVAADVGDLRHCVRPRQTGWLYRAGDCDSLAAAISEALADPEAKAVAQAGREHVVREHTWRGNAERVLELAAAALSGR